MQGQLLKELSDEFDKLTGLLTIDSFRNQAIGRQELRPDSTRPACALFADVSNFKRFNEKNGFAKGDKLLRGMAQILREAFPDHLVAHFSEDHFAVLLFQDELERGLRILEDTMHASREFRDIALKVGIYRITPMDDDIILCCDRAKIAADSIKRCSGVTCCEYDRELADKVARRHYLVEHLDEAIDKHYIRVHFQPIIRTMTGKMCALEALARWEDPEFGLIGPNAFIPILEEEQLIHKLDIAIIAETCRLFKKVRALGYPITPVSVNLSRLDFELCDIFGEIEVLAQTYQVPRRYLQIEITESVLVNDRNYMMEQIQRFHDAGYSVWMDDFGSEFSSMSILKDFNFDTIKIDMMFVRDFGPKARIIVNSIVNMAKALHMTTLAEGVETKEQSEFLYNIGCEMQQGYLYGKPSRLLERHWNFDATDERSVESSAEHDYMDRIGKISANGTHLPDLIDDYEEEDDMEQYESPMSIMEYDGNWIHHLYINKAYLSAMGSFDLESPLEADHFVNNQSGAYNERIRTLFEGLIQNGDNDTEDVVIEDKLWTLKATRLAGTVQKTAYAVELLKYDNVEILLKGDMLSKALNKIYTVYEHVDVLHLGKDYSEPLFSSSNYQKVYDKPTLNDAVLSFTQNTVYSSDQKRYLQFLDLNNMIDRIEDSGHGFISGCFRLRTNRHEDVYQWKRMLLIDISEEEEEKILACIGSVDETMALALDQYFETVDEKAEELFPLEKIMLPPNERKLAPSITGLQVDAMDDIPLPFGLYEVEQTNEEDAIVTCRFANKYLADLCHIAPEALIGRRTQLDIKDFDFSWEQIAMQAGILGERVHYTFYSDKFGHWINFNAAPIFDKNCFGAVFYVCDDEMERNEKVSTEATQKVALMDFVRLMRDNRSFEYKINRVLEQLSEMLDADRTFLLLRDEDVMQMRYEYCSNGTESQLSELQKIDAGKLIARWENEVGTDGCLEISDTSIFQDKFPGDYEVFKKIGARSLYTVILYNKNKILGGLMLQNYNARILAQYRTFLGNAAYIITSEILQEKMLSQLDFYGSNDVLTGVRNHNSLIRMEEELKHKHKAIGVVYGDINGLKSVNDNQGHSAGDQLIKNAAEILVRHFGKDNTYRAGGDEFTILIEGIDKEKFEAKYEAFLEDQKKHLADVSISTGAVWDSDSGILDKLMQQADAAMYKSKRVFYSENGRDRRRTR